MSEEHKDTFARRIATLSLVVAFASVIVPYIQQEMLFKKQQQEDLNVILNSSVNGPIKITDHNFGHMGYVVQVPWSLTVSNNGNRQLSIVKKRLSCGNEPNSQFYTGIDGGIFSKDYTPVQLPIKLEEGESQSFYIYVGTLVPKHVYELLKKLNNGNPVMDRDAMKALGEKGIDIYGNSVEYRSYNGDQFSISFKESGKALRHWLVLSTGRGNEFFSSASKYKIVQ